MPYDAGEQPLVLVVAADPDTRAVLSELLDIEGFSVIEAPHADDAWQVIAEGKIPHVILLDLRDPRVDGEAFRAQQLASGHAAIAVVIMTSACGRPSDGTLPWCTVLQMPFEVEALLAALTCAGTGNGATIRPT
jgi:CheY-like chemotaxis protein